MCSPDFSSKEKYNVADTYNQKTDRQDTAGSVYQKEIFKRRSRYIWYSGSGSGDSVL